LLSNRRRARLPLRPFVERAKYGAGARVVLVQVERRLGSLLPPGSVTPTRLCASVVASSARQLTRLEVAEVAVEAGNHIREP
jgi:hypothetical protein